MRHLVACQDPSDRGRIQTQFGGEHHGATLAASPGGEHLLLDPLTGALRHSDRPRTAIGQRRVAALVITAQPLVHRRPRNTQLFSDMRGWPTSSDTLDDQSTSEQVGTGVSVRHEDLLRVNARHIHSVRRSSQFQAGTPSTTCRVTTPNRHPQPSVTGSRTSSNNRSVPNGRWIPATREGSNCYASEFRGSTFSWASPMSLGAVHVIGVAGWRI